MENCCIFATKLNIKVMDSYINIAHFNAGRTDCKSGYFDKWYRYNTKDDGASYLAGWRYQSQFTDNDNIQFININL